MKNGITRWMDDVLRDPKVKPLKKKPKVSKEEAQELLETHLPNEKKKRRGLRAAP